MIRTTIKRFLLFVSVLAAVFSSAIFAEPIKKIVFFGDSLTDNGNLYRYIWVMPKSPPYYLGQFSNGPVWAEGVGQYYRDQFNISYSNFAVGGATMVLHNPLKGCLPLKLSEEIDDYLLRSAFSDRSAILFVILMGANDYMSEDNEDPKTLVNEVNDELISNITTLINHGAKNFLIMDLPDLSKTPRAKTNSLTSERLHLLSQLNHEKMLSVVESLKAKYSALTFAYFDTYYFFNDILAHPEKYNQEYHQHISTIDQSCWPGGYLLKALMLAKNGNNFLTHTGLTNNQEQAFNNFIAHSPSLSQAYAVAKLQENGVQACTNPDAYLFWDQIHPTAVTHEIFAKEVEKILAGSGLIMDNRGVI